MYIFGSRIDSLTLLKKDAICLPFPKKASQNSRAGQGWRKTTEEFLCHSSRLGKSHKKLEGILKRGNGLR